jgi:NCAIR mutase (PurE)-related protein
MIVEIAETLIGHGAAEVLITRLPAEPAKSISARFAFHRYHPSARTLRVASRAIAAPAEGGVYGPVAVVTAGSTDRPVAAEAAETLAWMGVQVMQMDDIGVAGPQRLLSRLDDLRQCQVAVVAAGMEGALPSVLAGHVPYPVIAVPTSVGYGAALGGLTPLLTMLTSCASNVAVVNIDAGFKGGYLAGLIARKHVQS